MMKKEPNIIKKTGALLALTMIVVMIICMQPAYAAEGLTVTVDKSKLYPSDVVSGSDSVTVWSGYITVRVKDGNGDGVSTSVKAVSKGEQISSIENTNSAGKAVLPILTDTPPPLIKIWVKNPTTGQWFGPGASPSIVDPVSSSSGGGKPRGLGGGGSGDAASPLAIPLFLILSAAYVIWNKHRYNKKIS